MVCCCASRVWGCLLLVVCCSASRVRECLWFPADVGVITNHQRQGKCCFIGIERLGVPLRGFRIENLGFLIRDSEPLISNHKL